ncbi:MAG: hypothetical protein EP330_02870 [Deltaproteobacteria bacterium]|nr:MAG: hypothetical protein EP330_02870 [Deltaproteobacteria bacterium]
MFLLWLALTAPAATIDRIAAVVNDDVIALSEVYELGDGYIRQACPRFKPECVDQAEVEVLDSLIQRSLIRQELYKLGLQVTPEEIDRTIDQVGRDNGITDREQLRREVERAGLTWDVYREQLTEQLRQLKFTESVLRPRVGVREDEVQERYRRATKDYSGPPTAKVEALALALPEEGGQEGMIATVTQARELAAKINAGEVDWKQAIAEYDSGLYAPREGEMGSFRKGELMESLDAVVFSAEVGKVNDPVVVGSAVFLVKVVEKKASDVLSYEEAAPKIREQLFQEKIEREMEEWTVSARRRAAVKVLLGDGTGSNQVKRVKVVDEPAAEDKGPGATPPTDKPAGTAGDGRTGGSGAKKPEAPAKPEEPATPAEPAKVEAPAPAEPAKSEAPAESAPTDAPTKAEEAAGDDGRTGGSGEKAEGDAGGPPAEPAKSEEPAEPAKSEEPAEPAKSEEPAEPAKGETPADGPWAAEPAAPAPTEPAPETDAEGDKDGPWGAETPK